VRRTIAQFIPYRFKMQLRAAYGFLAFTTSILTGKRDPLLPPDWLLSVGDGDYKQIGEEFFRHFIDIGGLRPHERVLDVGCGTGRIARPLMGYLKNGSYDGIDIAASSIKWCQKTFTRPYPNFHFHFADIYNKMYNPIGTHQASEYRFPFENSYFDFVFLTSVFTHMFPQDMENYLTEVARVLKPGGRCFITYFLLNPDSLKLIEEQASSLSFKYELQGYRVQKEILPEEAIAYDEKIIRGLYRKYELNISEPISYGSWCGRKNGLSYQDIVIASKHS